MNFEWTIKLGDIIAASSMIGGAAIVAVTFLLKRGGQGVAVQFTLEALTKQLAEMETEFKAFTKVLQDVAVQKEQIGLLMKWYDELRRGIGKIG